METGSPGSSLDSTLKCNRGKPLPAVILAVGRNPEERTVLLSFLWIPVTPVITADGCNDWGDENDGGRRGG